MGTLLHLLLTTIILICSSLPNYDQQQCNTVNSKASLALWPIIIIIIINHTNTRGDLSRQRLKKKKKPDIVIGDCTQLQTEDGKKK